MDYGERNVNGIFRRFAGDSTGLRDSPRQFPDGLSGNQHWHVSQEAQPLRGGIGIAGRRFLHDKL
ncbi:MAG: hypothetical protein HYR72_02065 [Deltaproteobacteria bacterium]|nr:hypothetical protein [Deltaproteobacteria bacterium]MBI3387453.1 hypothetical protein [Deltaproteobacteria bacterium]